MNAYDLTLNSYVEALTPQCAAFGGEALGDS